MHRLAATLILLVAVTAQLLFASPAHAWEVRLTLIGAGQVTETTDANLVAAEGGCESPANTPSGTVGAECAPGSPSGEYNSAWLVRYVATPKPGYRFVHWQSPTGGPVICDGANGASTYAGTACQFSTWQNLAVRAVFIDDTAPSMASLTGPNQVVNGPAAFTFSASADPTFRAFECRVPGVHDWQTCTSGHTENPPTGAYTMEVRAFDWSGNRSAASTWSWSVDKVTPETSVTSAPSGVVASTSATFEFTSNEQGTFHCALDMVVVACSSPKTFSGLSQGGHTFSVAARDQAGNVDPTPVVRTWTVDTVAPDTTITNGPDQLEGSDTATFLFDSSEAGDFACTLDGAASACSSPMTYDGLPDGEHTFTVAARDSVGNMDATPATLHWTIDTHAPEVASWKPSGTRVSRTASPSVVFSEAMQEATVEATSSGLPTSVVLLRGTQKVRAAVVYRETTTGSHVATLDPKERLRPATVYTVKVRPAALDLAGNSLTPHSWKFRTRS